MLRESVELTGGSIDFDGLTDPACVEISGVPHSRSLLQFTNACMGVAGADLQLARQALATEMSAAALVDTAGVISNFQRMVRIADATGIPVDGAMQAVSKDLRQQLGIDRYVSAANSSPPSWFRGLLGTFIGGRMLRRMIRKLSS